MNLNENPNLLNLINVWDEFQKEVKEIQLICNFPVQIKDKLDKMQSIFTSINQQTPFDHNELYTEWENTYEMILDPTTFFEIDQAIENLKNKESILKFQEDVKLEDVNKFSLFVMAFTSLQKSWKQYFKYHTASHTLTQYAVLINDMYSFFEVILTDPQHQNTADQIRGIETALFSLLYIISNFHFYEKFINAAIAVSSAILMFKPKSE